MLIKENRKRSPDHNAHRMEDRRADRGAIPGEQPVDEIDRNEKDLQSQAEKTDPYGPSIRQVIGFHASTVPERIDPQAVDPRSPNRHHDATRVTMRDPDPAPFKIERPRFGATDAFPRHSSRSSRRIAQTHQNGEPDIHFPPDSESDPEPSRVRGRIVAATAHAFHSDPNTPSAKRTKYARIVVVFARRGGSEAPSRRARHEPVRIDP
jgi:hypothetical protein